jgi:hypothetical protein
MTTKKKSSGKRRPTKNSTAVTAERKENSKMEKVSIWKRVKAWASRSYYSVAGALSRAWDRVTKGTRSLAARLNRTVAVRKVTGAVQFLLPTLRSVTRHVGGFALAAMYLSVLAVAPVVTIALTLATAGGLMLLAAGLKKLEESRSRVAHVVLDVADVVTRAVTICFEVGSAVLIGSVVVSMGPVAGSLFGLAAAGVVYHDASTRRTLNPYDVDGELRVAVDARTGIPMPDQGGQGPELFPQGRKVKGPIIDLT